MITDLLLSLSTCIANVFLSCFRQRMTLYYTCIHSTTFMLRFSDTSEARLDVAQSFNPWVLRGA